MYSYLAIGISVVPVLLLTISLTPRGWAEKQVHLLRSIITGLTGLQSLLSLGLLASFVAQWLPSSSSGEVGPFPSLIQYNGLTGLMFALVSFIGWTIARFSTRYLDGESTQGRYYCWLSFTLGAVCLTVLSANLLLFFVCWAMTSWGLHQLLTHYSDRPVAIRAAWTKFAVSRIGDLAIIGAMGIYFDVLGTLNFAELTAKAADYSGDSAIQLAGVLLAVGAITKSAQIPFHTWLPLTMETPTPVSALMHAGIVNAGGYLMIRTSSLVSASPAAMVLLIVIGGSTACVAALIMLTQTSVKRKLAYSTIAQMGFMLLQCGFGAFSAAMLHILAHSLYKAHAFLSSGSVIRQRAAMNGAISTRRLPQQWIAVGCAVLMALFVQGAFWIVGIDPFTKPGGLLLGGLLCLSLTFWLIQIIALDNTRLLLRSTLVAAGLCLLYATTFRFVDLAVSPYIAVVSPTMFHNAAALALILAFVGLFSLHWQFLTGSRDKWLNAWYVHASNGFYIDSFIRRICGNALNS